MELAFDISHVDNHFLVNDYFIEVGDVILCAVYSNPISAGTISDGHAFV